MTARVIDDPSALGWEYDDETGRWTWGGGSGNGGGGGGSFPEAPVDGRQYGRQNAGWTEIVHPNGDGGVITTENVQLTNPTAFAPGGLTTQEDVNNYFAGEIDKIIADAPANGTVYGRKDGSWVSVPTGGGDGGDVNLDGYATEAWVSVNYQPKGAYLTPNDLNGYATQTWVSQNYALQSFVSDNYQRKGNYLTSETDPVFTASPAAGITQNDINKWNAAGSSATPNLQQVTDVGATTNKSPSAPNWFTQSDGYTLGGTSAGGARIIISNGLTYSSTSNVGVFTVANNGTVTANGDVTAFSDARLKENVETLDGSKVYEMRGVSFLKDGREGSGVIAQELQKVAPELVHDEGEYLSVSYGNLVGYLIEAVKELKAEVEELRANAG